jgi:hypothetical protein
LASIANGFILFLGVIAALNQIGIATTVTTPVLIAILATIAGVIVVGAGGGLIKPMQTRWEGYLTKAEEEAPKIKQEARNARASRSRRSRPRPSTTRPTTPARRPRPAPLATESRGSAR